MAKIFSIYTLPTPEHARRGDILGNCILERDARWKAISAAEEFFETRAFENGSYGPGEEDVLVVSYDGSTDKEIIEPAKLSWFTIRPAKYEEARFQHLAGIGAIRRF